MQRRKPGPRHALLALALALAPVLAPLPASAAHAPEVSSLVIDDATQHADAWFLRSIGAHQMTLVLTNDGGENDAPIRLLAVRVRLPDGSVHVVGPEIAHFLGGATDAPGSWTFEASDLDRVLEPAPGDGVSETLIASTDTGGIAPGASASFVLEFDVRERAGWGWSIRTASSDTADEVQAASLSLRVDDRPPTLAVSGLSLPLATNATELTFNGTVSETGTGGSGLALTEVRVVGPTNATVTLEPARDGTFDGSLDLAALAEGNYTLRFLALDRAGNDGGFNGSLVVDRTPPRTTYRTPPVFASRPVVLAWSVADNVGPIVATDVYRFVNGAWVTIASSTLERVLPVPSLLHGDRASFRVVPHDLAGNAEAHPPGADATRDLTVLVDVLPPMVLGAELSPTADGYRVVLHASDADSGLANATLTLLAEGLRGPETVLTLEAAPDDGTYTFDIDAAGLAAGPYGVDVAVEDQAGNEARATQRLEVFVGDVLPVLVEAPRPPTGQTAFRKDQPVTLTVIVPAAGTHTVTVDASGLGHPDAIPLADDGVAPDERAGDGAFTATVPVRAGAGLVPLGISARSDAGARGVAQVLVAVDTARPQITILEPLDDSQVGPSVTLKVEAFDERPGVRLVRVLVNEEEVTSSVTPDASTGGLVLLVDATGLPHGTGILSVEASDMAGNVATAEVVLDVDATPPVVSAVFDGPRAPREGWFTGPFRVGIDAEDPESGIVTQQVALGDAPYGAAPLTIATLGAREVHLHATNGVSQRTVRTVLIGLDAEPPELASVRVEKDGPSRTLVVAATDDVGIESVEAYVGGGWTRLAAVGDHFVLALPDDVHEVQVRATDPAGNEGATRLNTRQSDVPAASWISCVLVLGLLSLSLGRGARRWR